MSKPGTDHWVALKRILRYIKGSLNLGLVFHSCDDYKLYGLSDADWAGDESDRKSYSGYLFRIGCASISWKSLKQSVVALSTAEAEYIALCSSTQHTIWLKNLLNELLIQCNESVVIYEDNQGTIELAKNPKHNHRTKHIDLKYHFVRDAVMDHIIKVKYCPTEDTMADIFTKALSKVKFEKMRTLVCVDCTFFYFLNSRYVQTPS